MTAQKKARSGLVDANSSSREEIRPPRRGRFGKFLRDEAGAIAILTGVMIPVFMGFTALGIDAAEFLRIRHTLQQHVDAAAMSGAWSVTRGATDTEVEAAALREANRDGYNGAGNFDAAVLAADPDAFGTDWEPVQASIDAPLDLYFAGTVIPGGVMARVRAVAVASVVDEFCVVALAPAAPNAIQVPGTASASLGCGVASNSIDVQSLSMEGGGYLSAEPVATVGDIFQSGSSTLDTETTPRENAPAVQDPYSDLAVPDPIDPCDHTDLTVNSDGPINPGVYCGGLEVTAGSIVTLNPGVYIMDRGSFVMRGNSSVAGDGVTMIFTSSTGADYGGLDVAGGSTVQLSAPTSGDWEGILFFQDPNAPDTGTNELLGGSDSDYRGVIYFPNQHIEISGGSDVTTGCTRLVARTIAFNGNAVIGNDCDDFNLRPLGTLRIRLVG